MATFEKAQSRAITEEADFLHIKSIDHVHFYVGNAKHAKVAEHRTHDAGAATQHPLGLWPQIEEFSPG